MFPAAEPEAAVGALLLAGGAVGAILLEGGAAPVELPEAAFAIAVEAASPAARGSPAKVSVLAALPVRLPPCFWNSASEMGGRDVAV